MSHALGRWADDIDRATDELDRRRLLGDIGRWRADPAHLTDIPAQRAASYALSTLHDLVGDREAALHEANQLVELCKVPPVAPGEARDRAHRHQAKLLQKSGKAPKGPRGKSSGPSAVDEAVVLARRGDRSGARSALRGRKGARARLARLWIDLLEARASDDIASSLDTILSDVEQQLSPSSGSEPVPREAPAEPRPQRAPEGPLETLLGVAVDRSRKALRQAIDAWADQHPERADDLAAAALLDHVQRHGEHKVAPWLFDTTLRALGQPSAPKTEEALSALGQAHAVTAYREPGFQGLREATATLRGDGGWRASGVRRGLGRGEPQDRLVWRAVFTHPEVGEAGVACVPEVDSPWPADRIEPVVGRLQKVMPVVLWAPGEGNQALRDAAEAVGVSVVIDGTQVPDAVRAVAKPSQGGAKAPGHEPRSREVGQDGEGPVRHLVALLQADAVPVPADLMEPLGMLRRITVAFRGVASALAGTPAAYADPRLAVVLDAAHEVTPADVQPVIGVRLAVEFAARAPDGAVAELLASGGSRAVRYGGASAAGLARLLAQPIADGWSVDRLDVGLGRRETSDNPALKALWREARGLWRVRLTKEGATPKTLWWVADPTPEAVAAAAILGAQGAPEVVVALDQASADLVSEVRPQVLHGEAGAAGLREALAGGAG